MKIVTKPQLEQIKKDPAFTSWGTWTVVSVICSYCDSPNTVTPHGENERCEKCGADLKKGKLLVGLLGNEGVFLDLDA